LILLLLGRAATEEELKSVESLTLEYFSQSLVGFRGAKMNGFE
jgi:hypothetical protein